MREKLFQQRKQPVQRPPGLSAGHSSFFCLTEAALALSKKTQVLKGFILSVAKSSVTPLLGDDDHSIARILSSE